jgi:hypothetical protein
MTVRKIEIERLSITSSKPFAAVVTAIKASVGQPDMVEFAKATRGAGSFTELERKVRAGLGKTGLLLFMELEHVAILRKESGNDTPKIVRLVIGNPAHHEGHGEACSRRGILRADHDSGGRAA